MIAVTAAAERPVYFEAGGNLLFGMLTEPEAPNGLGVVIVQGGDTVNVSLQRNRMAVELARRLAGEGFAVLRFDYHGLGESSGVIGELRLSTPFTEDAEAAAACLRSETGVDGLFLAGACFSSRTSLSTAPLLDDVVGVVMATPPIANYERREAQAERMARDQDLGQYVSKALSWETVRNLANPRRRAIYLRLAKAKLTQVRKKLASRLGAGSGDDLWWVSEHLLDPLETMVERQVPVMIAYGVDDPLLREFQRAEQGRLGRILTKGGPLVDVRRDFPGVIHGFPQEPGQRAFIDAALEWITTRAASRT